MQDDAVEVLFCELCGTSVSVGDLAAGAAVRHQGKTVGPCCLGALRGAAPPAKKAAGGDTRLLPLLLVTVAAVAAAALFVDHRLGTALASVRQDQQNLSEAQKSDSQVLAGLAVAMDAVPRRIDLDALVAQVREVAGSAGEARADLDRKLDALGAEIAAVAREQRQQATKAIDYRPLFDDLRQRQIRLIDLVSTLRAVTPAVEPAPPAEPAPAAAPEAAAGLPPALADQVKKLQAGDPAARFEAVDELLRSKDAAVLPHLLPMTRDADAFVRRLTVEGLAAWKRPEVVEALLAAMADGDEYVRDTAWRSLKEVTGQKLAFESGASKDNRARALQKWLDWWEKNKATFGT